MREKLKVTKNAQQDLDDAYQWYQSHRKGLGDEFIRCIDVKISGVARDPFHYPIVFNNGIRRALTNRFPYSIYFVDEENLITVIAILHQRQRPDERFNFGSIGRN